MESTEILIVGGGVAGLATAWHLAREGARVHLLEREELLGAHASSQNAAILRTETGDSKTTELMRRSAAFLADPPHGFAAGALLEPCGVVLVARERAKLPLADGRTSIALDGAALREWAPHLSPDIEYGVFYPREGRLDVSELVDGYARGARAAGASLETGRAVQSFVREGRRVVGVIDAHGHGIRAERIVLAPGGWAQDLARAAGSRLEFTPRRRHLLVTANDSGVDRTWPVVWRIDDDEFYCRPESGGLLICACDESVVEPNELVAEPDVRLSIAAKTARNLPAFADADAASFWCGLRTFTEDGHFAIGPDADVESLYWIAGLGGHGMGASPEAGRLAALHVLGRAETETLSAAFLPARLAGADATRS